MDYGFSYMGFLFTCLILAPAFFWVRQPGYAHYRSRKSGIFQGFDRIGLTLSICVSLIFRNYDYHGPEFRLIFLILAWIFLILFEIHWIFCCHVKRFPYSLYQIPLTVLSPLAWFLLGIYGKSLWLILGAALYGIGHVFGDQNSPDTNWHCSCCSDQCDLS